MMDIFLLNRERMIASMQSNLKVVRQICGWSAQELGEYIGVTRQTINNVENQKTSMSATQYIAICALLDKKVNEHEEVLQPLISILSSNIQNNAIGINDSSSFLEKWFISFPESNFNPNLVNKDNKFSENDLKTIAKHYKIFINVDSLQHSEAEEFFNKFAVLLKEYNNKLIVPFKVIKFIQDNMLSFNKGIYKEAAKGLNLLAKLQSQGLVEIRGESTDNSISSLLQSVFARHRVDHRLFLLTQNTNLAKDILVLNHSKTIQGYDIVAARLNDNGDFELIKGEEKELMTEENVIEENEKGDTKDLQGWDSID